MVASNLPIFVQKKSDTLWHLLLWIQPGAKKTELSGTMEDRLKIRLNAPPVDNKANTALIKYIAKMLGLRTSRVELLYGDMSRQKTLAIDSTEEPDWSKLLS